MAISLGSMRQQLAPRLLMTFKVVTRSLKLFALGLFINNGRDTGNWRITGVLQVRFVGSLELT